MPTPIAIKRAVPFIISLAMFMEGVDTTIINTAIPAMSRSLHVNPIDLKIALISYLVSLAIFIPISGWLADKFGVKRIFILAIAIFTASSLWCGFAHNLSELVIARTAQGLGGSLTLPVGRLIIVKTFERNEFITTMARVVIMGALGPMLGPVLGGVITHNFSWRWIFWVNIPFGFLAIAMSWYWLTDILPQIVPPLDKLGFILFGSSLAGLVFSFSAISETTSSTLISVGIFLLSILGLVLYVWHSRTVLHPIINTELFHYRTFRISFLGNLFARLGFGGVPFLLPLLLQIGLGYSSQLAGVLLAPIAVGLMMTKPFLKFLLQKFGFKHLLIINTILLSFSLWSFMSVNSQTSIYVIGFQTFIFGFIISMQYSCMNPLAYAESPADKLSAVTSIMGTTQQLAQSFGVAISAILLRYYSAYSSSSHILTPDVFKHTFLIIGLITLCATIIFTRLNPDDGHQMIE